MHNTQHVMKAIIAFEQRVGYNFKSIHSDAGTEFFSNDLLTWLQQRTSTGIPTRRHMAAPDTQRQNGFCERHWGHIKQMAHKMLVNARLPLQFLFYALQTACYIHACLPHSGLISSTGRVISPYECQKGVPPRISQIRVFGCPVIYRMHKTLKWETSGKRGVHVGPARDMDGYNVYNPIMGQTAQSNDFFFDESFKSALSYQVPTKTKDGDLPYYFKLFGRTLDTHHERHQLALLDLFLAYAIYAAFQDTNHIHLKNSL